MKDPNLADGINSLQNKIDDINRLIADLVEVGVEVKIAWRDETNASATMLSSSKFTPHLELWRAKQHIDYLTKEGNR